MDYLKIAVIVIVIFALGVGARLLLEWYQLRIFRRDLDVGRTVMFYHANNEKEYGKVTNIAGDNVTIETFHGETIGRKLSSVYKVG